MKSVISENNILLLTIGSLPLADCFYLTTIELLCDQQYGIPQGIRTNSQ